MGFLDLFKRKKKIVETELEDKTDLTEKTKYRLKAEKTVCGDLSLQFYHNECWYYVPEEDACYVLGDHLTPELCDEDNKSYGERYMTCFMDQESFDLIPFTKKYPLIKDYFEHVQAKRVAFLAEETRKRRMKDIYL